MVVGEGALPVGTMDSHSPFKNGPSAFRKCTKSSNRITPSPISTDGGSACASTGSEPDDGGFVKLIVADMTFLPPCSTVTKRTAVLLPVLRRCTLYTNFLSRLAAPRKLVCK